MATRRTLVLGTSTAILYFSEGLPFGVVKEFVPLYLRFHHVDLTSIGLMNAVGFAWTLKFLWSPLVDAFGTYRRWITAAVLAITIALTAIAFTATIGPLFYALLALLALASGTQDIAVDAFTIRTTPAKLLGPVNSIRITAYRIALTSPGILALVAQKAGWPRAFGTAAVAAALILVFALTLPDDRGEPGQRPDVLGALKQWLTRPGAGTLLAIAFTFRLGEFAIIAMIKPYWVDRGYSPAEIGTITSIIGVIVSIASAVAGGAIVARFGLFRSLMWLGATQCLSNIGYALVATTGAGRWAIYAAAIVENIGYGLGVAAFLAFLMSLCDRDRAATEYALLSAAYALTGTLMQMASGKIIDKVGYAPYFWLTVILGIPSLVLIAAMRRQIGEAEQI